MNQISRIAAIGISRMPACKGCRSESVQPLRADIHAEKLYSGANHAFGPTLIVAAISLLAWDDVFAVPVPPGTSVEEHAIEHLVTSDELDWGGELFTTVEIPRFDTWNGTRHLLDMRFAYRFTSAKTMEWDANPHDVTAHAQAEIWKGVQFGPFNEILGIEPGWSGFYSGHGACRPPLQPASIDRADSGTSWGYDWDSDPPVPRFELAVSVEDPDHLATFMGSGVAMLVARWWALEPLFSEFERPPGVPLCPENASYTPHLLHPIFEGVSFELVVYYAYELGDPIFNDGFE